MKNWIEFLKRTRELLEKKQYSDATEEVTAGLEIFPNQPFLLFAANEAFRASGDRETSVKFAELLHTHHPRQWQGFGRSAQDLAALNRHTEAQEKIKSGLEKLPNQFNLLTIASDIYRASNDHNKSLEFSSLLLEHHPRQWQGFGRSAQDLAALNRLTEAQEKIQSGLEKLPNQFNLLTIASDIYRASNDHNKSLEFSSLLLEHHPRQWQGFGRSAQDLAALNRLTEAQEKIQSGLEKLPNQFNLLTIASDIYRASNDHNKSLEFSSLLLEHHPRKWQGFGRSAQDLATLKRFEEAHKQIQAGLKIFPYNTYLRSNADDIYHRWKHFNFSSTLGSNSNHTVHVTIEPNGGSREHYYHFLLGVLLPFTNWITKQKESRQKKIVLVKSCEILDKHFQLLGVKELQLCPTKVFDSYKHLSQEIIHIDPFDNYHIDFNQSELTSQIKCASRHLLSNTNRKQSFFSKAIKLSKPKLLLINRTDSNQFYRTPQSQIRGSGKQRRSIPNFNEIAESLHEYFPETIELEELDLSTQIHIFNSADIIVAQHGAALTNIVFCNKGTKIVEINAMPSRKHFSRLSNLLELEYFHIRQNHDHASVNITTIKQLIAKLIYSFH